MLMNEQSISLGGSVSDSFKDLLFRNWVLCI